jgi:restriction system protein
MAEEETPPPDLIDTFRDALGPTVESLLDIASRLWWFWVLFGLFLLGRLIVFLYRERRLARSGIRDIDRMDGGTFERYLQKLFQRRGYRVDHVGSARGDYGGDLLIQKNGTRTLVQAKRYAKNVGVAAVQQAVTAKAMYECTQAMVVTNSGYTQQARKLAAANDVQLLGRDELISMVLDTSAPQPATPAPDAEPVADPIAAGEADQIAAACARCGVEVSDKVRGYCLTHDKRFGGLVYCYKHQHEFKRRK